MNIKIPHFNTWRDRDRFLRQLYLEKSYYVFFYGLDKFNQFIENVHKEWVGAEFGNDWVIDRICWEIDNLGE